MFVELSVFNLALFIFLSRGVVPLVFRVRPKIVILNSKFEQFSALVRIHF